MKNSGKFRPLFRAPLIILLALAVPGAPTAHAATPGTFGEATARLALDASGNVYIVGTSNVAWLGTNPVRAFQGGTDAFVAKLNPNGALVWLTFLGGAGADRGNDIAVSGNAVYVVGTSYSAWGTSPTRAYSALNDAFAARLDAASGALQWHAFLGGAGDDYGTGSALDGDGNIYVAGTSSATWASPLRAYSALHDAFAARLNPSGALQWNTFLGGAGIDEGADIATDAGANVYVIGSSSDAWGAGAVRAYSAGWDAFAAELNGSGALQRFTFLGGAGQDCGYAIVADAGGDNLYAAGGSTATWGVGSLRVYSAWWDGFAVRLNGSGALQWNTFLGSEWSDASHSLALDGSGNLFVVGAGDDGAWGISPARAYNAGYDAHVAKLNTDGVLQMLAFVGGEGDDFGAGMAVDTSGNLFVAGVNDTLWGAPVQSYGDAPQAFALKMSGSGALQWHTFLGGEPYRLYLPLILRGVASDAGQWPAAVPGGGLPRLSGLAHGAHFLAAAQILNYGSDGDDTQIELGTEDPDIIIQYGRGGDDTQFILGGSGDDWIEQHGEEGNDNQAIFAGSGNDWVYQLGGDGDDIATIDAGSGDDWVFQDGGIGNDDITTRSGLGNNYLYQNGGPGADKLKLDGGGGDDLVRINSGSGNDTLTYNVSEGADQVFIDGGTGRDTLTINAGIETLTLLNAQGQVLFQQGTGGSAITVRNMECITVYGLNGEVLFSQCGF
ncbi:MAG: SBBP repeat-containing protein [Thermoflexales bacterium]|nr:SBBP repeat-containing protein [Thermoflexales bacterium]